MIKRLIYFCIILLYFLVLAYLPPVLKSKPNVTSVQNSMSKQTEKKESPKKIKEELPTDELSKYIAQPIESLTDNIGEAEEMISHSDGSQSLTFGDNEENYMQVETTQKQEVKTIFILGEEWFPKGLKIGMNLSDISGKIILSDQFTIKSKEESFQLELTGNDLNMKPLIKFVDGSYGLLHLDQEYGKLIGMSYLSEESLMDEGPYEQFEVARLSAKKAAAVDEEVTLYQERQFNQMLKIISTRESIELGESDFKLNRLATELVEEFVGNPNKVMTDKKKLALWETKQKLNMTSGFITLEEDEVQRFMNLKENLNVEKKDVRATVITPVRNVNFLVTSLFSGEIGQQQMSHFINTSYGFAIKDGVAVILDCEK